MTNGKEIAATYVHIVIELCIRDRKRIKIPEKLGEK